MPRARLLRTVRLLGALCVLASCSACAGVANTLVAPHNEYSAYRNVRTARGFEQRLRASSQYLQAYPNGRWTQEVRPWFDRAEARYWSRHEESYEGLAEYLALLPRGPHAARAELELRLHRKNVEASSSSDIVERAREQEARLARVARERETARDSFGAWLGRLLEIQTWGDRTSALDSGFLFAWRIDKPRARCVDDRCAKLVELPFELPGGNDLAKRVMLFEVVVMLRDGVVVEARIEGPGLFSRLFEASKLESVSHDDTKARSRAIRFAADFVSGAAESRLPSSRCSVPFDPPEVMKRSCDGWYLHAAAAEDPASDDVIVIRGPLTQRP